MPTPLQSFRMAAVGDILLSTKPGLQTPGRGLEALSEDIRQLFDSCDIVLGNLECTLPSPRTVPSEPRVLSTQKQITTLRSAGVNVVTLGNNHAFDCLEDGFAKMVSALNDLGIRWCGAGMDSKEAMEPVVIELAGIKLAFLGFVDEATGMKYFAGAKTSGVGRLNLQSATQIVSELSSQVDHIVLTPHWGDERFRFPSPQQVKTARALAKAGATLILGHHPHVLQGMETFNQVPIVYSLGNFMANPVYWENGDVMHWSRFERTSCITLVEFNTDHLLGVEQIPVFDDGEMVRIDSSGWGRRCLRKANQYLTQTITPRRYAMERYRVKTMKPILAHLRWSELRRTRPSQLLKAFRLLLGRTR